MITVRQIILYTPQGHHYDALHEIELQYTCILVAYVMAV